MTACESLLLRQPRIEVVGRKGDVSFHTFLIENYCLAEERFLPNYLKRLANFRAT